MSHCLAIPNISTKIPPYKPPVKKRRSPILFFIDRQIVEDSSANPIYESKTESCIRAIDEMYSLCSQDNWDDNDEKALQQTSVELAKQFVNQLSLEYAFPEPVPEPNGNMGLEWIINKYRLGLSIDKNSLITYAAITPNSNTCGTIKYEGQIPEEIKLYLDKMIEE